LKIPCWWRLWRRRRWRTGIERNKDGATCKVKGFRPLLLLLRRLRRGYCETAANSANSAIAKGSRFAAQQEL
jgi:hypothetical protein